jgi:hypothetical protein
VSRDGKVAIGVDRQDCNRDGQRDCIDVNLQGCRRGRQEGLQKAVRGGVATEMNRWSCNKSVGAGMDSKVAVGMDRRGYSRG